MQQLSDNMNAWSLEEFIDQEIAAKGTLERKAFAKLHVYLNLTKVFRRIV